MNKKKKAAALALATLLTCGGALAGCDTLTTTNVSKDYAQVIAEVDLGKSEDFADGGKYAEYKELVSNAQITKREMVASYISSGYSLQQQYNWTYADTFNTIADSLVNRQIFVQYAKVYLMQNYAADENLSVAGYVSAISGDFTSETAKEAAGLAYFLTDEEKAKANYSLKVSINKQIDGIEEGIIEFEDEHEHTADADVRTRPTGAATENADYYTENYAIYTGKETVSELGEYERLDGSTHTTRKKAYVRFLTNLRSNDLLADGENTNNFESLNYYSLELKSSYETAIINKLLEKLEEKAEASLTEKWLNEQYQEDLRSQKDTYERDKSSFETALDAMSDTKFVLAPHNKNYGFVLNILLPFSTLQTQELNGISNDLQDAKGNKFAARAQLLNAIRATDQRGTWFTGHDDFSYVAESGAFNGGNADRNRLFFKDSFTAQDEENAKYETIKNYNGKYTYNGKVTEAKNDDGEMEYTLTPNKISIDGFLTEMKSYLEFAGLGVTVEQAATPDYFTNENYYDESGAVDYGKFIYEIGKITDFTSTAYNANNIFLAGSKENTAFSVINELSFAYNTDTAGLNSYLGYSVSPFKTSYMSEFEYAAQLAVSKGAGTYAVVPTDYGWHVIYCTFSFADAAEGENSFTFNYAEKETEGTFSYLYFEALKSTTVNSQAKQMQDDAINTYVDACSTIYKDRYADLINMGNKS